MNAWCCAGVANVCCGCRDQCKNDTVTTGEHIGEHFVRWARNYAGSCSHLARFLKNIEGDHVGNDTFESKK